MIAADSPKARIADELGRRFLIDVFANGAVQIRERGKRKGQHGTGGLPVFSTDTREQAEELIVYHCRLARDRSGIYHLNTFDAGNIEDLVRVSGLFAETRDRWAAEVRS